MEAVLIDLARRAREALLAAFAGGCRCCARSPWCRTPRVRCGSWRRRPASAARLARIGFMRRYDAEYQRLKALLDGRRLGRPLMLHCVHRNVSSPPHFTSAMLVTSSVSHEIDAARWLLGRELSAVTVVRPRPSAGAPEGLLDPQFVLFETEGGAVVDVEIFVNSGFGYEVRCEAVCEAGSARIGAAHTMVVTAAGGARGEVAQDYLVRFADAYDREVQSWVDATRRGRVTGPGAWDGYAAAAIAEAGRVRALETGARTPSNWRPSGPPRPGIEQESDERQGDDTLGAQSPPSP